MIRFANQSDIPLIVSLAGEEHAMSRWKAVGFDAAHVAGTAASFITDLGRTLIVSGGGYLAGMLQPLGFAPRLMALEYAWYSNDGTGLLLLAKFERWAKRMGAAGIVLHSYIDDRLGNVLSRRFGYERLGSAYCRDFFV